MKKSAQQDVQTDVFHRFDEYVCTMRDIIQEIKAGKVWNIPNLIMFSRLGLGIYFIQLSATIPGDQRWIMIPFAILMLLLDMLDGTIARKYNQQTMFGKIVDPLCDKILLVYAMYTLFRILEVPTPLTWGFFSTHIIMVLGVIFLLSTRRKMPAVRIYGAISNVLAVISGLLYWLNVRIWGRRFLIAAIVSGYALLTDYALRIDWSSVGNLPAD